MNRRNFIQTTALMSLTSTLTQSFLAPTSWAESLRKKYPLSILQGLTNQTETQLTIDTPIDLEVFFRLIEVPSGAVFNPTATRTNTFNGSPWAVHFVKFSKLPLNASFLFQVVDKNQNLIDERNLSLLDLSQVNSRIALVSCMRDTISSGKAWKSVTAQNPDLIVMMGDNVYGDLYVEPGPLALWTRYIEARLKIEFYHWPRLVPTIATWDDHDFGKNNTDGNYIHKESSLNIFKAFYGRDPIENVYAAGPGIASVLRAFGVQIIMLDDRYFRSEKKQKNGSSIGAEQAAWALARIKNFNGPTWIVHGSQFFGAVYGGESYEGQFYNDFMGFLEGIKATGKKVVFASGDVHFSEIMDIESSFLGYKTFELTSSSLHSLAIPWLSKNPRRIVGTPRHNHLSIEQNWQDEILHLEVRSISSDSKVIFKNKLEV